MDSPPLPVAVAISDAIVVARVVEYRPGDWDGTAVLDIERSLKGDLKPGKMEVSSPPLPGAVGDRIVLHLDRFKGTWLGVADGSALHTPEVEAAQVAEIARLPAWPAPQGGWTAILAAPAVAKIGDPLDVWVVYKNTSDNDQNLPHTEWPLEQQTRWDLEITRDGAPLAPIPYLPEQRAETLAHFEKNANSYDISVVAGETHVVVLSRVQDTERGWGYKEQFGYRYWPMNEPGTYEIRAKEENFPGRTQLVMPPVSVVMTATGALLTPGSPPKPPR